MLKSKYILTFFFLLIVCRLFATHNRAGEITYVQINDFTYEITITTFTNTQPTTSGWPPVDRPVLEIDFGDNTSEMVDRVEMIDLPDYYRKNTYVTNHTFPGPGTYSLVVEDPNRNEGIANIPNSVTVVFSIKTIMQINPSLGPNSTPQLLSPPVDKAAKNRLFIHNPAAWDPDGDSLSYELTPCTGENGEPIPGFEFPDNITMNPVTGDLVWDKPTETGAYNVAILIEEWRDGVKIGQITRDLQIEVYETENMPPDILSEQEICIEAGDSLDISLKAFDPDGDSLVLTPLGGAFELSEPAAFEITGTSADSVFASIQWATNCDHIRQQPYLFVIKAEDKNNEIPLADLHHIQVWVNGPATQITSVESTGNSISLSWFNPDCQADAYQIYRKTESYNWPFDPCLTGIPEGSGYEQIATVEGDVLNYVDNDDGNGLTQGYRYCYRIVTDYGQANGYASAETCASLVRGVPVITNVSVTETDSLNGKIYLAWSRPKDLDTVENPGPYQYLVYRSTGIWGENFTETPVAELNGLNDTVFTDSGFDTKNQSYSYKVELHNAGKLFLQPMIASTLWLETNGTDNQIKLEVKKNVPWQNESYAFYLVENENEYLIGEADTAGFIHLNLTNGEQYRYKVRATGSYSENGFVSPIINSSQEAVGVPIDTIPPNPPQLTLSADCDAFHNIVEWQVADPEVTNVHLYFAAKTDQPLTKIRTFPYPDTTRFFHTPEMSVSGCYAVSASDSAGNESQLSVKMCIDSCDYYELPNVITTNNDGKNDIFRPITTDEVIEKVIHEAHITIFNRWGSLVYETTDPLIMWEGRAKQTNKFVPTGVYYYVCNLKEKRISGIEERYKVGFVHVYQSKTE